MKQPVHFFSLRRVSRSVALAAIVSGAACGLAAPVAAASAVSSKVSPMTQAFLANVSANTAFLDAASRLAAAHAQNASMRSYAKAQLGEEMRVADALENLAPGAPTMAVAAADAAPMTTGRSAAIDPPIRFQDVPAEGGAANQAANGRSPLGPADLAALKTKTGKGFDDLFWEKQLDALSQIESDYRAYIARGDDPVLVALARRELPVLMERLKSLTKV